MKSQQRQKARFYAWCEVQASKTRIDLKSKIYLPLPDDFDFDLAVIGAMAQKPTYISQSSPPWERGEKRTPPREYLRRCMIIPGRGIDWAIQSGMTRDEIAKHFRTTIEIVDLRVNDRNKFHALNTNNSIDQYPASAKRIVISEFSD